VPVTVLVAHFFSPLVAPLVAALCLVPPVDAPVVEPFVAPACSYCTGHRTVDFANTAVVNGTVVAPIAGRVSFAGEVAGRRFVSVRSGDHTVTVGGLGSLVVSAGQAVAAGETVGRGTGLGPVTLSVRRDAGQPTEEYLDPGQFLARRIGRARLVPTDGTRPRPVRTRLVCPTGR